MTAIQPQQLCGVDAVCFDLDGVLYRGPEAVAGAVAAVNRLTIPVLFLTNNASRPPAAVAAHLAHLGYTVVKAPGQSTHRPVQAEDVLTSSQVGARLIAQQTHPGTRVLAVGGEGVPLALVEAGLQPVRAHELLPPDDLLGPVTEPLPEWVLQGLGLEVGWPDLAAASYALAAGARWVATNADPSLPTAMGTVAPGNGSFVQALIHATGHVPTFAAKPEPAMFEIARDLLRERAQKQDVAAPECILMVGDRLDTDILGARRAGFLAALVLTGVSSRAEAEKLSTESPEIAPNVIASSLQALFWEAEVS